MGYVLKWCCFFVCVFFSAAFFDKRYSLHLEMISVIKLNGGDALLACRMLTYCVRTIFFKFLVESCNNFAMILLEFILGSMT